MKRSNMARRAARASQFVRLKGRRTVMVRLVERVMHRIDHEMGIDSIALQPRPIKDLMLVALREEVMKPIVAAIAQCALLRALENNRIARIRARPFLNVLQGML